MTVEKLQCIREDEDMTIVSYQRQWIKFFKSN